MSIELELRHKGPSLDLAATLPARLAIGWCVATLASVGGLYASFKLDVPTGAAIVRLAREAGQRYLVCNAHGARYRPDDGLCVEPQTGPPDAVNIGGTTVVTPDRPLMAWMDWRWDRPVSASS